MIWKTNVKSEESEEAVFFYGYKALLLPLWVPPIFHIQREVIAARASRILRRSQMGSCPALANEAQQCPPGTTLM